MNPELAVVAFGLLSSLSWGVGDFSGGLAAKRVSAFGVVALAHLTGLLVLLAAALLHAEPIPPVTDLIWGGLAGLSGEIGLLTFYRALADGRMGIAAPLVAVIAALMPVTAGVLTRGLPPALQLIGFILGIISLILVGYSDRQLPPRRILLLAVAAGLGFGGFLLLIARIQSSAVFWPLVAARTVSSSVMLTFVFFRGRAWFPPNRRLFLMVVLAGLGDALGNVFFMLAAQTGRLDVAAVVSSLYPAMTVVLAWLVLKERLTRIQIIGIALALVAIACITFKSPQG